jgi:hypothetical protein
MVAGLIAVCWLVGCQSTRQRLLDSDTNPAALRSMQTRVFDTADRNATLRAAKRVQGRISPLRGVLLIAILILIGRFRTEISTAVRRRVLAVAVRKVERNRCGGPTQLILDRTCRGDTFQEIIDPGDELDRLLNHIQLLMIKACLHTQPDGDFFVRSGPGTVKLPPGSAREYIRTRFPGPSRKEEPDAPSKAAV